jgi:PhzF family phenazine biosynthesis protein
MPQLKFVTVDVFTTTRFLGNPLGIVLVPAGKDVETSKMQAVAREFNLSETMFVHEQTRGDGGLPEWRVRIFVTNAEIPFAGHPTIGAACYALGTLANGASKGRLICNAGPIQLDYANEVAVASIPHNFHRHTERPPMADDIYNLHPSLKKADKKPLAIDLVSPVKGMNFICTELPDIETLGQVDTFGPEPQHTTQLDKDWNEGIVGSFLYVLTNKPTKEEGIVKLRTRMLLGALEDPATGSASCGLCALLALKLKLGKTTKFELTQAVEMGRQSDIGVVLTLNDSLDAVEKMKLSGSAVKVMEGTIEL